MHLENIKELWKRTRRKFNQSEQETADPRGNNAGEKSREDLQNCIRSLDVDINKFSLQAEEKEDMSLLVKANSFGKTKEIKLVNVEALETAVAKLEDDLRNMTRYCTYTVTF